MCCHYQVAVLCFMPWEVICFLFCFAPFFHHWAWPRLCRHPSWCSGSCSPGCDTSAWTSCESPTMPTELFLWCAALSICCVCYAELRPAMVVLVNTRRPLCRSSLLFLFAVIMVAFNVAFLAYVVFLMVFRFWPHVLSKLVFMGSVALRLPFSSVCRFPTRFHGGYYSSCNFLSVLLLSCFLSVHFFQVSFLVCVIFKLVSLVCVTFRLFSWSVLPCSYRFWHVSLSF